VEYLIAIPLDMVKEEVVDTHNDYYNGQKQRTLNLRTQIIRTDIIKIIRLQTKERKLAFSFIL
jgi:hypothetical protein